MTRDVCAGSEYLRWVLFCAPTLRPAFCCSCSLYFTEDIIEPDIWMMPRYKRSDVMESFSLGWCFPLAKLSGASSPGSSVLPLKKTIHSVCCNTGTICCSCWPNCAPPCLTSLNTQTHRHTDSLSLSLSIYIHTHT